MYRVYAFHLGQPNLQDQLNLAAVAALQKPEKIDLEAFQKQQYLQSRQPKSNLYFLNFGVGFVSNRR